jgi:predicted AAA+ superfamily ATPase
MLCEKQLELITQIIHRQARFRIFAVLLGSPEFRDRAREDLAEIMREYSELAERAAAILPTDLWVEIKNLNGAMSDLLGTYDQKKTVDKKSAERIAGMDAKVALMSRVVLGVDALTDESLGIFSSTKGLERVAAIESDHYLQLARDKDA